MLAETLIKSYFTPSRDLSVALVDSSGRVVARETKPQWRLVASTASATVTFGPFPDGARFSEVVLMDGDDVVDVSRLGEVSIPPGATYVDTAVYEAR